MPGLTKPEKLIIDEVNKLNFKFTKEQKMLQSAVQEYMKDKITPIAAEYDQKGAMSKKDALKFLKGLIPFGYIGTLVPEKDGGPGLSHVEWGIIFKELRKAYGSLGGITGITSSAITAIYNSENQMLKKKCLPDLLKAKKIACLAITEPDAGSDPSGMSTRAVLNKDHYIINGTKMWISNGTIADYVVLTAVIASDENDEGAIGQILVEKDMSPFKASEIHKIGVRSFPTSELVFTDCKVPAENIVWPAGQGFKHTQKSLTFARCNAAIAAVGIAEAALEAAIAHAKKRVQFGKQIGKFQMVQQLIAEMAMEVDAAELLSFRALSLLDEGELCRKESSMAKAYSSEMAVRVTSKALQVHGAYGLAEEYPLERYFRDARCFTFLDGTTQIQQLIIAREILGLSAIR